MRAEIFRWFQANGFPGADREGLAPGVIAVFKSPASVHQAERAVPGWMAETEAQRQAAGADVALLVVRRDGTADVGEWWAFVDAFEFAQWCTDFEVHGSRLNFPVRLLVADAARLLRAAGFGTPLDEEATA